MNICFVCTNLGFGGAERVMSILSNSFVKKGHKVTFLLNAEKEMIAYHLDSSVEIRRFWYPTRFYNLKKNQTKVNDLHKEFVSAQPDVIIIFDSTHFVEVKFAVGGLNIPIIFSQRNDPNSDTIKLRFLNKYAIRHADGLVFQSAGAQNYYGGKARTNSSVIMNPFYQQHLQKWMYCSNEKKIISVGRLCEAKNHKLLIDAFSIFSKLHPEYILEIFGDGPLKKSLEAQINKCGLEGKVLLMGIKENVFDFLKNSSMFVLSSDSEGVPNALIEAMSIGMPCVSTDCSPGGARELINNEENGIIVPINNPKLLADAMCRIAEDSKFAVAIGEKAFGVKDKVDVEIVTNKWLETIKETIRRKQRS